MVQSTYTKNSVCLSTDQENNAIQQCFGHSNLFTSIDTLKEHYESSLPFTHLKLSNFVDPDLLEEVRTEILEHLHFTEKETDIYQIHQTGDLVNMDGLKLEDQSKLPKLSILRTALYSARFRAWVSELTGCGELSGIQQDLAANAYSLGCYLLNHDDVIGTRKVSYILYLMDPKVPWHSHQGGALELYSCVAPGIPDTSPSTLHVPAFNQCVLFEVQPGVTFHAVQEVVCPKAVRLSVSGWFHAASPSSDANKKGLKSIASLAQLETPSSIPLPLSDPNTLPMNSSTCDSELMMKPLTEEDRMYLSQYITPEYLESKALTQIHTTFCDTSIVQLTCFLNSTWSALLHSYTLDQDTHQLSREMNAFEGPEGWAVVGNPVHERYLEPTPATQETTKLGELNEFWQSQPFRRWLSQVTGYSMSSIILENEKDQAGVEIKPRTTVKLRRFRPGFDYTLATPSSTSMIDLIYECTPTPWSDPQLGGYVCYVSQEAKDSNEETKMDPAIYQASTQANVLTTLMPSWNTFNLIVREPFVTPFIKYIRHRAPCCRWEMVMTYPVDLDSGDE